MQTIACLWKEHTTGLVFTQYAIFSSNCFQFMPCRLYIPVKSDSGPCGGRKNRPEKQDPGREGRGQAAERRKACGGGTVRSPLPPGREKPQDIDDPDARMWPGKGGRLLPFAFRNKEILRETGILYTGCKGSTIKNQTNTKK